MSEDHTNNNACSLLTALSGGGSSGKKSGPVKKTAKAAAGKKRAIAPKSANDDAPNKKRKYTRRKQQQTKKPSAFGAALCSADVEQVLAAGDKAEGGDVAGTKKVSKVVKSTFQPRKPTQTVLANGDASLTNMVRTRQAEYEAHQGKVAACRDNVRRYEEQLRVMKRTRRNIRHFNETSDALERERKRLTLLEIDTPPIEDFYGDLNEFLRLQAEETAARRAREREERLDREGAPLPNDNRDTADDQPAATAENGLEAASDITSLRLAPSHRARTVTAGAPLFDGNQFAVLRIARADLDSRVRASMGGDDGAGASGRGAHQRGGAAGAAAGTDARLRVEDALFDGAIAKATRSSAHTVDAASPMVFVLSPVGRGIAAPCIVARGAAGGGDVGGSGGALDGGDKSGARAAKSDLVVVTIGKNTNGGTDGGSDRRYSDAGGHTTTTRDNRNRLNVKMKDIRNMQNVSMMNFVAVSEREQTVEERQHDNFRQFLSEREERRRVAKRPSYADARCERCEALLDINIHTGMVSCTECGLAYDDGIDCHEWQAIDHVPHSKFEYLKSGHLMTLLKRCQGKESTVIPRDVIDKCALQLSREKFDLREMTPQKMKRTLKKLNLPRYYDHCWQLAYIVADLRPIQFSDVEEQQFQAVFDVLEIVYPMFKPQNAENFIFYWYIIGKTAQLLGHPEEVVNQFPLLKNAKKHRAKERLWQRMMQHLSWPFIPTKHSPDRFK